MLEIHRIHGATTQQLLEKLGKPLRPKSRLFLESKTLVFYGKVHDLIMIFHGSQNSYGYN
jgi:hypothetical protein